MWGAWPPSGPRSRRGRSAVVGRPRRARSWRRRTSIRLGRSSSPEPPLPSSGPCEACRAAGAKRAVPLPVSAPFHCALMAPAQERLAAVLDDAGLRGPGVGLRQQRGRRDRDVREPSVATVSCGRSRRRSSGSRASRVLVAEGVDVFVEVGPGTVLSGLVKKIAKGARVLNVEDPGVAGQGR